MTVINKSPLYIEFIVDDKKGVYFGWNLVRGKINHGFPIWDFPKNREVVSRWIEDRSLNGRINQEIQKFFNGAISCDINLRNNYPYRLYEYGKDEPCFEGFLRIR